MNYIEEIAKIKNKLSPLVKTRLKQFEILGKKDLTVFDFKPFLDIPEYKADIFSEACFCLLTANSSAKLGIKIQSAIGIDGFRKYRYNKVLKILKNLGHRFAEQRAERIIKLRKKLKFLYEIIKEKDSKLIRKELVKNVFGYGYKEASHFLRNIGFNDVAIIDRHIIRYLTDRNLVERRKTITPKVYIEAENALALLSKKLGIKQSELDLYIFYLQSGNMLK